MYPIEYVYLNMDTIYILHTQDAITLSVNIGSVELAFIILGRDSQKVLSLRQFFCLDQS